MTNHQNNRSPRKYRPPIAPLPAGAKSFGGITKRTHFPAQPEQNETTCATTRWAKGFATGPCVGVLRQAECPTRVETPNEPISQPNPNKMRPLAPLPVGRRASPLGHAWAYFGRLNAPHGAKHQTNPLSIRRDKMKPLAPLAKRTPRDAKGGS